jgi:hypothetical protein
MVYGFQNFKFNLTKNDRQLKMERTGFFIYKNHENQMVSISFIIPATAAIMVTWRGGQMGC